MGRSRRRTCSRSSTGSRSGWCNGAGQDYPEELHELVSGSDGLIDVPAGALTVDYLLGPPEAVGRGLGPRVIRVACDEAWPAYPDAPAVIVPVAAANRRSWRALEKAGFRRVGEADLEPDNPVDDRQHVVYRLDRSTQPGGR